MTNHVHLLMTPREKHSISSVMQSIGRRYVQYINQTYRRTGTLWEGRHKASLVDEENYLLICMRYIELNPVRTNLVSHPSEYRWSSYRCNASTEENKLTFRHDTYDSLGFSREERAQAYRSLFSSKLEPHEVTLIRQSATFSMPVGNSRFKKQIEKALNKKIGYAQRGRPIKD